MTEQQLSDVNDREIMIRLENLTKRFPGQDEPAVADLSLDIPEGEIVVLVGPSGCGKTTTMKLVNRLIEPTSGTIFLEGDDVTHVDPDELRRRIGYVIQQIGLFPHMTIRDNIATVPKLLGWDTNRIDDRVDELLDTVGMDPALYRDRYPKELSGGQRQRVGVARAMSADPPVMLMDEPFGAIDPITRERLQNEFLRIQQEIRKTIIFVTHDIDEAIKMGDRIAILEMQSRVAQYDTPERILVNPASDFVSDFIGAGASLKRLGLTRVRDVELTDWPTVAIGGKAADVEQAVRDSKRGAALLVDDEHRPQRWIDVNDLDRVDGRSLMDVGMPTTSVVEPQATLADALNEMLTARYSTAVVVDRDGAFQGVIDIEAINQAIQAMRESQQQELRHGLAARKRRDGDDSSASAEAEDVEERA